MSTLLFIPELDDANATTLGTAAVAALRTAAPAGTINQISLRQVVRSFDPATWTALQHGHGAVAVAIPAGLNDEAAKAVRAFAFAAFTGRTHAFTAILCNAADCNVAGSAKRRQALDFIRILDMPKASLRLTTGDSPLLSLPQDDESVLTTSVLQV